MTRSWKRLAARMLVEKVFHPPVYGCGHSEIVVGKALKDRRDQTILMTKVGLRWDSQEGAHFFDISESEGGQSIYRNLRPESIRKEIEGSLSRLKTDYIDLIQCHWPDPSTEVEETMSCLADLVQEGKIRAVGVSNFDVPLLKRAQKSLGAVPLASNQPRYSLLQREIEQAILPHLHHNKIGSIVYSPIAQGLLAGSVSPERIFPEDDGRCYDPAFSIENRRAILQALNGLRDLTEQYSCTFAQMSAAWCFHQLGVTAAIVGARTPEQAEENAKAALLEFSEPELQRISSAFDALAQY